VPSPQYRIGQRLPHETEPASAAFLAGDGVLTERLQGRPSRPRHNDLIVSRRRQLKATAMSDHGTCSRCSRRVICPCAKWRTILASHRYMGLTLCYGSPHAGARSPRRARPT
jgi:hypothetical protein